MNNVIEVKNLSKTFRVKLKDKGLKGSITFGEFLCLCGSNIFENFKKKMIKILNIYNISIIK